MPCPEPESNTFWPGAIVAVVVPETMRRPLVSPFCMALELAVASLVTGSPALASRVISIRSVLGERTPDTTRHAHGMPDQGCYRGLKSARFTAPGDDSRGNARCGDEQVVDRYR